MHALAVAVVATWAYGEPMSSPTRQAYAAVAAVPARLDVHRPLFGVDEPDRRFFGPQVPTENPVNWIAERAPPSVA